MNSSAKLLLLEVSMRKEGNCAPPPAITEDEKTDWGLKERQAMDRLRERQPIVSTVLCWKRRTRSMLYLSMCGSCLSYLVSLNRTLHYSPSVNCSGGVSSQHIWYTLSNSGYPSIRLRALRKLWISFALSGSEQKPGEKRDANRIYALQF